MQCSRNWHSNEAEAQVGFSISTTQFITTV